MAVAVFDGVGQRFASGDEHVDGLIGTNPGPVQQYFGVELVPARGLPLIQVMFSAQVINGLLLPIILVFVMKLAADKRLMGDLVSGPINLALGWLVTGLLVVMSLILVVTAFGG